MAKSETEVIIPDNLLVKEDEEENKEVTDTDEENVQREEKEEVEVRGESDFSLPDKFKGKSTEEIAQAYVELEKSFGRQGQEVGE
ncbi:MAG: hypothetical protein GTO54_01220, partial [Nitrososphaeria archaeon]|nr:hypothetical protein [Nitrososphaeria archaeon]